jgi:ABC-type multidrug transport system ATPase subunit
MRIRIQNLSKHFGKVHALENVSLVIEPGTIVALVGPNGAGKTTLLRCLSAVVGQQSGEIFFDDELFMRGNLELRRRIAFLPDFPLAFGHNTVLRHIGMVLRIYNMDSPMVEPRVMQLLRDLDLMPLIDTPMMQLSRGQAYKTALAALLAVDPELLLLDEPFASGMDPNGITVLKRELLAAARRGQTVIYSTQILDIAEKLSDYVGVIDRGELRHYAPLRELQSFGDGDTGALEHLLKQLRETAQ